MYPKNCRFVRKEQELISPLKVEIESEEPVPDQLYYCVRANMIVDGLEMGDLDILIPALPFGLELSEASKEKPDEVSTEQKSDNIEKKESVAASETEQPQTEGVADKAATADTNKQKKLVDKLLKNCEGNIRDRVSALLGVDVILKNQNNKIVSKEDFFLEEISGKQVLAHMDVVDEVESKSYLFVGIKDAIRIGSILIMLPPAELETSVSEEDFSADAEDAYGEIANIISGVYTSVFQEQYPQSIRFIKTDLEIVSPMKVDVESNDVIQNEPYYLSCSSLEIDGNEAGKIAMLFPLSLLKLDLLNQDTSVIEEKGQSVGEAETLQQDQTISQAGKSANSITAKIDAAGKISGDIDVLLIEDNREEAVKIQKELTNHGIVSKRIEFEDNIDLHMSPGSKLIMIIMKEVDEQAYGITIKVNSLSNVPIVAAGPEWTRTKVIKAVKYGVDDILLTPAMANDIKEKVDNNIMKLAA